MTIADGDEQSSRQGTVIMMSASSAKGATSPQRRRPSKLLLSFVLCVCLPFVAATVYYAALATDRYAAYAGFSIRGIDTSSGVDSLGALTGLASTGSKW